MTASIARRMIAAEILKLRRNRGPMLAALALTVGVIVLFFALIEARRNGEFGGEEALANGATLLGMLFGSLAAILIGAEAGTIDASNGVFRDLVATGRSRLALFAVRVPAAAMVALAFTMTGYALTVAAAVLFGGPDDPAPALELVLRAGAWVALATVVASTLSVGVSSLTGSRSVTLTVLIGLQMVASQLIVAATFLGSARDVVPLAALGQLRPWSTDWGPGFTGGLPAAFDLPMATSVAVAVLAAWTLGPAIAGAWRTVTQDA